MKRLAALALIVCLLPLCAMANRERITSFTPEEQAIVSARFEALLETTAEGEAYPACCEGMTEADRLLFVPILFDCSLRSTGVCDFALSEPVMLYDVPAALRMIGAHEQALLVADFLSEHDPAANPAFSVMGMFSCDLAASLYPFGELEETLLALDMETTLTTLIARCIASGD